MAVVLAIALAKLALHCFFNDHYDYFRDEYDYLACGDHPAWGYVDQPPLAPWILHLARMVLGDSLRAIRFPGALAISAAVVVTGMIARELGGRAYALILSALAVLIAPMYLSDGCLFGTNSFEPLLWMGCAYFAILAVNRADPRYWLWFGVVAGIGLEEKYSIAVLGGGIVLGLLLTRERRYLLSRWLWMGGAAAFLIFLPNLIWNYQNHFPFVELMHNIKVSHKDVALTPLAYFKEQLLLIHPLNAPIWITGLIALFFSRRLRTYRFLGWCFLFAFAVMCRGKNYYLSPIYPMLLAAGAVTIESGIARTRQKWLQPVIAALLLAAGARLAPVVVPVLPIDQFLVYLRKLPFQVPKSEHSFAAIELPQHYADQFGWREMTAAVAQAWQQIPVAERADCAIFGQDYGEAGAIDFLGPAYGLPKALSGHQTYFLWGPRGYSGNCMIVLNDRREVLESLFEHVEYMGTSRNPYALESNAIFICKGKKFGSLEELWPNVKLWR
jgi:4-amino-4-deoxy-L-arabinose transferase-like glycosyltransferase